MTFSTKISISVSAAFIACFIVAAYAGYKSSAEMLETEIRKDLEDHAFNAMDKLDRMLHERHADTRILSKDPVLRSGTSSPEQITERLNMYKDEYGVYTSLSFFDMNRIRIADTSGKDIGKQHALTEYWREIMAGRDSVMKITESSTSGQVIIHFVAVVRDLKGRPFGVVAARLPVESIYEIVDASFHPSHVQQGVKIELLDRDGLILYSSYNKKGILKEKSGDLEFLRPVMASEKSVGSVRHAYEGEDEISAYAVGQGYKSFAGSGWVLVTCTPATIALAPAYTQRKLFAFLGSGFIVLVLAATFFVSRAAVAPLKKLAAAAKEIGRGNFGTRVDVSSDDEVGQLAMAFNTMTAELGESEKKARGEEEKLRTITNTAQDAIVMIDPAGRIAFWNLSSETIFGYNNSEAMGRELHTFIAPKDYYESYKKGFMNFRETGQGAAIGKTLELEALRKGGETFPIELSLSALRLKDRWHAVGVIRDITERKKSEARLRMHQLMTETLNNAMVALAKDKDIYRGDIGAAFKTLTRVSAEATDICRVSIWFYTAGNSGIRCMALYDSKAGAHSEGIVLEASAYPAYFDALKQESCIAADDAIADPRTREFTESYLRPLGITSMLDVPIWTSGKVIGVVCHEHVGAPREWTSEEQGFATAVAGFASLAIEIHERLKMETSLRMSEENIRKLKEDIELKLDEVERINRLMVGRELKMEELRAEIRRLKSGQDKPERKG
ncbi:MAG: PAS domain S-box protein [Nitrospirae bacterium]|nr:PAS domain S-box protein [Nitrospirota bacterium]